MSSSDVSRVSGGCLYAVPWGVVLLNNGCNPQLGILWWLAGAICCGITLNTSEGRSWPFLVVGSLLCSLVLTSVIEFNVVVSPSRVCLSVFRGDSYAFQMLVFFIFLV